MTRLSVAVIGAGIGGLACAQALKRAGIFVAAFDKGRSAGGRIATRRIALPNGQAQFDHGAQFLTIRDERFGEALAQLVRNNNLKRWHGACDTRSDTWVGAPGMSALAKGLSHDIELYTSKRITSIERHNDRWRLHSESADTFGPFDSVIVATPAEQAAQLLAPVSEMLAAEARSSVTAPCWAGLFAFSPEQSPTQTALKLDDHPLLDWLAPDSSKPDRPCHYSCWVAHAKPAWSRAHIEDTPETVAATLGRAVSDLVGISAAPLLIQAHRWRYARVERTAQTPFGWDEKARIGVCGDWRIGPSIESAWLSGDALGRALTA